MTIKLGKDDSRNDAEILKYSYAKKRELSSIYKNKLKVDYRPNFKCKTAKLIEEYIGESLSDSGFAKI